MPHALRACANGLTPLVPLWLAWLNRSGPVPRPRFLGDSCKNGWTVAPVHTYQLIAPPCIHKPDTVRHSFFKVHTAHYVPVRATGGRVMSETQPAAVHMWGTVPLEGFTRIYRRGRCVSAVSCWRWHHSKWWLPCQQLFLKKSCKKPAIPCGTREKISDLVPGRWKKTGKKRQKSVEYGRIWERGV